MHFKGSVSGLYVITPLKKKKKVKKAAAGPYLRIWAALAESRALNPQERGRGLS